MEAFFPASLGLNFAAVLAHGDEVVEKILVRRRRVPARIDVVRLDVEDEILRRVSGRGLRLRQLRGLDAEKSAEDRVHRRERGRHAAGGAEELAPSHAQPFPERARRLEEEPLDAPLRGRLRRRVVLLVRHDACRNRQVSAEVIVLVALADESGVMPGRRRRVGSRLAVRHEGPRLPLTAKRARG